MPEPSSIINKLPKIGSLASFILAAAILMASLISTHAVNTQQLNDNTQTIKSLKAQVDGLQQQVAQQEVIANELKNIRAEQGDLKQGIISLANELHQWQRDEYRLHHANQ